MKWIYVLILAGVIAAVLSSDHLRSFIFSSDDREQVKSVDTTEEGAEPSGRLQEVEAASELGGEVAR